MKDWGIVAGISILIVLGLLSLRSIATFIFPLYFFYLIAGAAAFIVFSRIDFDIWTVFYRHFYVFAIALLLITLLIGTVTRGTLRWIQIGPITLQSTEIVRPFLLLFFSVYLSNGSINLRKIFYSFILLAIPVLLILVQPSLGVSFLVIVGYFGVVLASPINKKFLAGMFILALIIAPITWRVIAPYQKERIASFLTPHKDPAGAGYQSIQSMIAVGSGKLTGRGLGEGVQTQLAFLPERHTDFMFASIAEELGFVGALLLLLTWFFILFRLIKLMENSINPKARMFITGVILMLLIQVSVHAGMNMGILPITGIPLPLVSAGGSSFVATMIALGLVVSAKKS